MRLPMQWVQQDRYPLFMCDYRSKIHQFFPNAETIPRITSSVLSRLQHQLKIPREKILLATSICSDEVNHNANGFGHQFKSGEFILGGIGGYPFSGETGLAAFLSHIPDGGAALIVFGSHVGISKDGYIGLINRHMQSDESTSCGALSLILDKFAMDMKKPKIDFYSTDYQMDFLGKLLFDKRQFLLDSENPMLEITRYAYSLIEKDIRKIIRAKKKFIKTGSLYILGGILINTDAGDDDYFDEILFEKV